MESTPDPTLDLSAEQSRVMDSVIAEYQETRHKLKNLLAVMMAMAELAERNPTYAPRLISCVLEKGPEMVGQMEDLTRKFKDLRDGEFQER